jgi:hypothetical protein
LSISPPPIANTDKINVPPSTLDTLHTTSFNPSTQVLALANIEAFEISAAFYDGFDTSTGYAHTAPYGKISKFKEVQGYAAKGGV